MSLTRKERDALVEMCQQAEQHADTAANVLDGAAIFAAMTRAEHRDQVVRLVGEANLLHHNIRRVIAQLEAVKPDE